MTDFGKAAREKARELTFNKFATWRVLTDTLRQALDALDAADSDNARLQARVSELEAAVETATPLIGARNDVAHPAIKEANINEAWHVKDEKVEGPRS